MDSGFLRNIPKSYVSFALIVFGTVLVLYVASQYGQMYLEQRRMERAWVQEQQRRATEAPVAEQAHAPKDDGMVRLVIPKIDLESFIVEGTTRKALLVGPGHMTRTAEPGEAGNAVITAHRDTFFRHIHELDKGDQILVERGGKRFVYEVTGKKIVEPTDLSVTRPSEGSQVTLITCYPTYFIGPAPKRLVVFSKLANQTNENAPVASSRDGSKVQPASLTGAR
ncbi:MAG TPA: class D sortase [Terriglobales bacterium]|nr:class D sortase [Terriglobales bacterium]